MTLFGVKQSWEAKAVSGSGVVYLWWVHITAACWGYWWLPVSRWQSDAVSAAADLAGASLGAALPATILTEGVIVLVRMLLHDRRQRILQEGREEGREEGIEQGREEGRVEGREEVRQEVLDEIITAAGEISAGEISPEEALEQIKERLRQSQRPF